MADLDYDQTNDDVGNPRYGQKYAVEAGNGGDWHVYKDGSKIFVANTAPSAAAVADESEPGTPASNGVVASTNPTPQLSNSAVADESEPGTPLSNASSSGSPLSTQVSTGSVNTLTSESLAPAPGTSVSSNSSVSTDSSVPVSTGGQNTLESQSLAPAPGSVETASASETTSTNVGSAPQVTSQTSQPITGSATDASTYTVKSGDTLSGIAAAHDTSLSQIEAANPNITNPDLIFPKETINLPTSSTYPPVDGSGGTGGGTDGGTGGGGGADGGTGGSSSSTVTVINKPKDLEITETGGGIQIHPTGSYDSNSDPASSAIETDKTEGTPMTGVHPKA